MPLFFFISGFLFDFGKYTESTSNFVKGRFKSLIVPYFCFSLLTCLFYFLLDTAYQPGITNTDFFKNTALYGIYSIFYALGTMISYNPPLWFLTCLFITELLFHGFAKKYYEEPRKLMFVLTVSGIIGYLYSLYVPFRLFWNADVVLSAVVFYGAGNLFRKLIKSEDFEVIFNLESDSRFNKDFFRFKTIFPVIFTLLNFIYLIYLLKFPIDKINMNVLKYGNSFSFYSLAFSGIFAFVHIFKNIGNSKILEYYGRNSLIVLALHFPMKDILTKLQLLFLG